MHNTDILASKILKEKYYPHGHFLKAQLGRQPSFIWRNFWNSRTLLDEALSWRVGDRSRIGIWSNKWVPTILGGFLQSPV